MTKAVWEHLAGDTSAPFAAAIGSEIAVKVIDERGNELPVIRRLTPPASAVRGRDALKVAAEWQLTIAAPVRSRRADPQLARSTSRPSTGSCARASAPETPTGRRPAGYFYRDPRADEQGAAGSRGVWRELELVNLIRDRLGAWRKAGRPGVTRATPNCSPSGEREGRQPRLFFAQLEAAETIIFLNEARADFLQGVDVPRDEPGEERSAAGFHGLRALCKMATGSGKTTVMGMLAAWSDPQQGGRRGDARFSDVVLVVCPNVTIRRRLARARSGAGRCEPLPHARPGPAAPDAGLAQRPRADQELARVRAGRAGAPARGCVKTASPRAAHRLDQDRRQDDHGARQPLLHAGGVCGCAAIGRDEVLSRGARRRRRKCARRWSMRRATSRATRR